MGMKFLLAVVALLAAMAAAEPAPEAEADAYGYYGRGYGYRGYGYGGYRGYQKDAARWKGANEFSSFHFEFKFWRKQRPSERSRFTWIELDLSSLSLQSSDTLLSPLGTHDFKSISSLLDNRNRTQKWDESH